MDWPELTVGVCTYKRPEYAALTISTLNGWLHYDGPVKFHIADGGSPQEAIDTYKIILRDRPVTVEVTNNLADMVNSCARNAGDVWMVILDDFLLRYPVNFNPDVRLLLEHPEVGAIRMSRLAFFNDGNFAELVRIDGLHWWVLDKARNKDNYMCTIGAHIYHRRFWDAYGDIPACPPNVPGEAEINGIRRFHAKDGPTVAVPMRFGEDWENHYEPFWHIGTYRTDDYAQVRGSRL